MLGLQQLARVRRGPGASATAIPASTLSFSLSQAWPSAPYIPCLGVCDSALQDAEGHRTRTKPTWFGETPCAQNISQPGYPI